MTQPPAAPPDASRPARLPNPWWIPPFLGQVPEGVEPKHLRVLGAVILAMLFEAYDLAMITLALPFIRADLNIPEADLGWYLGPIRFGAAFAMVLLPLADRFGRRRMFLVSLVGTSLTTVATGLAQNATMFVAFQMINRSFFVVGASMSAVMISEEFPAERRGWGLGILSAISVLGYGVAAILFSQVEHLPYGWRFLYFLGITPTLLILYFRKRVPETTRFQAMQQAQAASDHVGWVETLRGSLHPYAVLFRRHPARAAGITLATASFGFAFISAFQMISVYLIDTRGWAPWQFSTVFIVSGAMGITGNVVSGRLSDAWGRRWVGISMLVAFPIFVTLCYRGPGWLIPLVWVGFVFTSESARLMLRAFATELFATDHRGTATGWATLIESLFSAFGLLALGALSTAEGDLVRIVPWLAVSTCISACVLLTFPETSRRELEEID